MLQSAIRSYLHQQQVKVFSPKAFLFDMDGVLFDSMPYHASSWVKAFEKIGIVFSEYEVYLNEGRTGASTIQNEFLKQKSREATYEEIKQIYASKSAFFELEGKPVPMKGAFEVLMEVKQASMKMGIVTGSGQQSLLTTLNTYFPNFFSKEKMVTAYDVKHGKPDPEPYLMGLRKLGLQANEVVVIENAPLGTRSGVAAGMFTIAVNTGILHPKELSDAGAHLVLPSMLELKDLIPTICNY